MRSAIREVMNAKCGLEDGEWRMETTIIRDSAFARYDRARIYGRIIAMRCVFELVDNE